jgi:hypothetical protein
MSNGISRSNVQHPFLYITITDSHQRQNSSIRSYPFLLMLLAGITPASKERLAFTGANQDTKE